MYTLTSIVCVYVCVSSSLFCSLKQKLLAKLSFKLDTKPYAIFDKAQKTIGIEKNCLNYWL